MQQFPDKKGFQRYNGGTPQFYHYLSGKILFLKMVRGKTDEMFLKFHAAFEILYSQLKSKSNVEKQNVMNLKELFEPTINTESKLLLTLTVWETKGIEQAINFYNDGCA
ncbi:MAG: hypothetical protein WKF85_15485 [Chitinophagaceae bacterium]